MEEEEEEMVSQEVRGGPSAKRWGDSIEHGLFGIARRFSNWNKELE